MTFSKFGVAGLIFVGALATGTPVQAEESRFGGEVVASVDVQTYEAVTTYVYGEAAEAMFTATVALSRIETISDVLRRVVGQNLTCYEKLPDQGSSDPIIYTCKFIIQQGGKIVRP